VYTNNRAVSSDIRRKRSSARPRMFYGEFTRLQTSLARTARSS